MEITIDGIKLNQDSIANIKEINGITYVFTKDYIKITPSLEELELLKHLTK